MGNTEKTSYDIIPIKLDNGEIFLAEIKTSGHRLVGKRSYSFSNVSKQLEAISQAVKNSFTQMNPDKICVEFGVELNVEDGELVAHLVKGSGTANLTIKLEHDSPKEANNEL